MPRTAQEETEYQALLKEQAERSRDLTDVLNEVGVPITDFLKRAALPTIGGAAGVAIGSRLPGVGPTVTRAAVPLLESGLSAGGEALNQVFDITPDDPMAAALAGGAPLALRGAAGTGRALISSGRLPGSVGGVAEMLAESAPELVAKVRPATSPDLAWEQAKSFAPVVPAGNFVKTIRRLRTNEELIKEVPSLQYSGLIKLLDELETTVDPVSQTINLQKFEPLRKRLGEWSRSLKGPEQGAYRTLYGSILDDLESSAKQVTINSFTDLANLLNKLPKQSAGTVRLYRSEPIPGSPEYKTGFYETEGVGRFFSSDPQSALFYAQSRQQPQRIRFIDIPETEAFRYRTGPQNDYKLPQIIADTARPVTDPEMLGQAVKAIKIAMSATRRDLAADALQESINKAVFTRADGITTFRANQVLNDFRNTKLKGMESYRKAVSKGDISKAEQQEILDTLKAVTKLGAVPPGRGQQFGSGAAVRGIGFWTGVLSMTKLVSIEQAAAIAAGGNGFAWLMSKLLMSEPGRAYVKAVAKGGAHWRPETLGLAANVLRAAAIGENEVDPSELPPIPGQEVQLPPVFDVLPPSVDLNQLPRSR